MYCVAPLSPCKGHLISFHDDDDGDDNAEREMSASACTRCMPGKICMP